MRVLITGGTGFIGRPLVRGPLRRGWEVAVLTRRPDAPEARDLAAQGARLVVGDITDRASQRAAFEVTRPDLFFHNAGWYELGIPARARRRMWAVNVEGTENALSLAAEAAVRRVVYTSSTTALGDTGQSWRTRRSNDGRRRSPTMRRPGQKRMPSRCATRAPGSP